MSNGLLFFDPAGGERVSYADLLEGLRGGLVEHRPFARPSTPAAAIVALLRALVLRRPLTLLDGDLTAGEVAESGIDEAAFALRESVPGVDYSSPGEMIAHARSAPGFRLALFTSGTSGRPRRVEHDLEGLTRVLRVSPEHARNVWGLAYNPTHIAGVQVVLQAFFNGNPIVHLFQRQTGSLREIFVEQGITHVSGTPSFFRQLPAFEPPLTGVRAVTLGGERSDAALLGRLAACFPAARIRNLYAMTEAGTILETRGEYFEVPERLNGLVRIEKGRLELHASLLGSFERGAATEWFDTGDRVERAPGDDRRFRIVSRERESVNVGGHKVWPGEVEAALLACPGVRQARVYGRPSSVLGELLCAEVVAEADVTEPGLRAWLEERLQAVKVPRLIKRVKALPLTRSGKVERKPRADGERE